MNPRHKSPDQPRRTAHAPYNFVLLPEKVVPAEPVPDQDRYYPDRYTGYIECTMITESPLYTRAMLNPGFFRQWADDIRGVMKDEAARRQYAQFPFLDDAERPVIPGSSLRGMVRSLVEIAGYGKMQWVSDRQLIYRAVGDSSSLGQHYREQLLGQNKGKEPDIHLDYPSPKLKGGYLAGTRDGWAIQPAREYKGESFVRVEYADANSIMNTSGRRGVYDVYVQPVSRKPLGRGKRGRGNLILDMAITPKIQPCSPQNSTLPPGMVPAKLIVSGHIAGRHPKHWHCAVYEPDRSAEPILIPDELWQTYQEDSRSTGRKLEKRGDPLFYLLDDSGRLIYFGPTMMFRLPYPNTPLTLVPSDLRGESVSDLAEAIFGYAKGRSIPEGKDRTCAGRVFFTDAQFETACRGIWVSSEPITPRILASPKPTTFQHYLTQQEPNKDDLLDHYASPPPHGTLIRGHKLYWHKGAVGQGDIGEDARETVDWASDTQHTQIKPVKAGVGFRFRLYFENLSKVELGALLWVLRLLGEPGKEYRHKVGMGKPLGMGAVKIAPTLYLSDRRSRYAQLFGENETWHRAEKGEQDLQPFMSGFEDYVLERMDQSERAGACCLKDVERVKMLLQMLEWPGPNRETTRYMELEPANEYRGRPVLPDPLYTGLVASSVRGKRR